MSAESLAAALAAQKQEKPAPEPLRRNKSGDRDFNPQTDAVALHIWPGSVFVSDNKYRTKEGFLVDRNGSIRDPRECPECGSIPGELDLRFFVVVPPDPRDPRWPAPHTYTYCRRCVSQHDIWESEQAAMEQPARRPRR